MVLSTAVDGSNSMVQLEAMYSSRYKARRIGANGMLVVIVAIKDVFVWDILLLMMTMNKRQKLGLKSVVVFLHKILGSSRSSYCMQYWIPRSFTFRVHKETFPVITQHGPFLWSTRTRRRDQTSFQRLYLGAMIPL